MVATPVYMDNHATTRVDPRVVDAMVPLFAEQYGNPSSTSHVFGWDSGAAVEKAREGVARAIGATEREIVFTSGATESNNLAIRGAAHRMQRKGQHLVSVVSEHRAVLDCMARLGRSGCPSGCDICQGGVTPSASVRLSGIRHVAAYNPYRSKGGRA